MKAIAACASTVALLAVAVLLQGCGGGGGGDHPTPAPTKAPTPAPGPPAPAPPAPMGPLQPLKGVCYSALPCKSCDEGALPGPDMVQEGYSAQWGPNGRDDLGMIQELGGNAVRVYAGLGTESKHDHGAFLDRAKDLGVHVIAGFYTQNKCPDFDCFDAWKQATLAGFQKGFAMNKTWHPAVSTVVVMDAPDVLNFGGAPPPTCPTGHEAQCRVKAALSALDGILSAEQEAGVDPSGVNLTVVWSSTIKDSIDGKIKQAIAYFGFQDMMVGTANPSIAGYSPRSGKTALKDAFQKRWVHGMSTHSPWAFVKEKVLSVYEDEGFGATPWFIGEYRGSDDQTQEDLKADLKGMYDEANKGGLFIGTTMYQFQVAHDESAAIYGMYGLGNKTVTPSSTGDVCQEDINTRVPHCEKWSVYCLDPDVDPKNRAGAVASAWGGTTRGHGLCDEKAGELLVAASLVV